SDFGLTPQVPKPRSPSPRIRSYARRPERDPRSPVRAGPFPGESRPAPPNPDGPRAGPGLRPNAPGPSEIRRGTVRSSPLCEAAAAPARGDDEIPTAGLHAGIRAGPAASLPRPGGRRPPPPAGYRLATVPGRRRRSYARRGVTRRPEPRREGA